MTRSSIHPKIHPGALRVLIWLGVWARDLGLEICVICVICGSGVLSAIGVQSCRSAVIGLVAVARRNGMKHDTITRTTMKPAIFSSVGGALA